MANGTKKNIHDNFADTYYKYKNGKLDKKEKEAFEKQLRNDKLKRMAAEGLSTITQKEL